jgi:hypothetical protein
MLIIGCDFHTRFQQIAMLDPKTGEVIERRLEHENGEAQKFYATLPSPDSSWTAMTISASDLGPAARWASITVIMTTFTSGMRAHRKMAPSGLEAATKRARSSGHFGCDHRAHRRAGPRGCEVLVTGSSTAIL